MLHDGTRPALLRCDHRQMGEFYRGKGGETVTAAMQEVADIRRMQHAINITKSEKLKNDYRKSIKRKSKELREYCRFTGANYEALWKVV